MKKGICYFLFAAILSFYSYGYAEPVFKASSAEEIHSENILLAAKKSKKKKSKKKKAKKKRSGKKGGFVFLDNPYGENSSEWATIDLYSKPDLKGTHWIIDIYGTELTIKNSKGNIKKRVKNDFFKSAKITLSAAGGVYFYDNENFNRESDDIYGWVYLPSNNSRFEVNNFNKENTNKIGNPYYKIVGGKGENKELGGRISSILIKFSKMK